MFIFVVSLIIFYVLYSWLKAKPSNFPPGPPSVPILGSIPFMPKNNPHFEMEKWRNKYGRVVGFLLGHRLVIAVCEAKLVREVLKRDEFQARIISDFITERSFNKRIGIFFADGPSWQEQRRFTVRQLKEFGFGKTSMETIMLDEINDLMGEIQNKTVQVSNLFNISSVNVLWGIISGARYHRSDPQLKTLMHLVNVFFRSGNSTGGDLRMVFPFIKYILPNYRNEIRLASEQLNAFIMKIIKEHEETLDEKSPRDFIDVYITEMRKQSGQHSSYGVENLTVICADLFSAGAESVGNTLGFAIMYMVLYPEIQEKVHAVIDANIGSNRKPSFQDRARVPYIEAVLMEIQRCNTIAPTTPPRRAIEDTHLDGYFIPKNTTILVSLWSIMQDKNHWGDPENFRPSRFIDNDGQLIKDDVFIPFSVGKRQCPGEALARNSLFLFFTSLMQKFSVHLPAGSAKPSTECLSGFTTAPRPFQVTFKSR